MRYAVSLREFALHGTFPSTCESERDGGALMAIARCLLNETKVLRSPWNEATSTRAYQYNRTSYKTIGMGTPYRRMSGKYAIFLHLRVMGSAAYVLVEGHKDMASERACRGVLVGCNEEGPLYLIYKPGSQKVIKRRNFASKKHLPVSLTSKWECIKREHIKNLRIGKAHKRRVIYRKRTTSINSPEYDYRRKETSTIMRLINL